MPRDLVCISHLRWDFVFQRPQHLLTRTARERRVFYIEEFVVSDTPPAMHVREVAENLIVATPHGPARLNRQHRISTQAELITRFLADRGVDDYVLWLYTPMALEFARTSAAHARSNSGGCAMHGRGRQPRESWGRTFGR